MTSTCRPKSAIRDKRATTRRVAGAKKPDTGVCFSNAHKDYGATIGFFNLQLKTIL